MNRLLYAIALLSISSASIAGGGDLYYGGYSKNKQYGFDLEEFLIDNASTQTVPVQILPYKTHSFSGDIEPEVITGCSVVIADKIPRSLVCSENASSAVFRQVIYEFSGTRYLDKGSKFKCVHRCTPNIPLQFELLESGSGED